MATWDGLSRYDGNEFRNYYHRPFDTTSFTYFVADKVVVDQLNSVWVVCQGRQAVIYDRANDNFRRFLFKSQFNSRINDLTVGHDSTVWLTMKTFLYRYNVITKKMDTYSIVSDKNHQSECDNNNAQIVIDNKGGIWLYYWINNEYLIFRGSISDGSKLFLKSFDKIQLNRYKSAGLHNNTGDFNIYVSGAGKTWLFSKYGLFYLDTLRNCFMENQGVIDPLQFTGSKYFTWTEEESGIHIINTDEHSVTNIKSKDGNFIESVLIDKSGTIWSGDINQSHENIGLKKYIRIPSYFSHYLTEKNEYNSPNLVFPIVKDINDNLIVGTRHLNYLFCFKSDGTFDKIDISKILKTREKLSAISMVQDSSGIWICTTTGKIIYLNMVRKEAMVRFPLGNNDTLRALYVHNILINKDRLILNSSRGIYGFFPSSGKLLFYNKPVAEGTAFTLVKDGKEGFWLGTQSNTIIHLDKYFQKTAQYRFGDDYNIVEHICVGDSNDIWIALMGGGLGHLYPETGKMELFTTAEGLSNNVIYSILKDNGGNLWISTNNGISRFNPKLKLFRNFGKSEGLLINEFNSDSYFKADDGEMFFGGVGGLVGFYPDSINSYMIHSTPPPILLTDFSVSGVTRHFKKAVYDLDTLVLEKGDNNFQITFAGIDFQNSEKIKYRYRLLGENDKWIETDYRNRRINYANVTHKDYRLEIESTNEIGEWKNNLSVLIRIPDRLIETLWARITIIIISLSCLIYFFIYYINHLKLKARQIQDQLRMESLRGQMNPHFIFNSLNSINYFISKEDKVSANHYIADFSRLIRSILNNLSAEYIPFESELESINDYLMLEYLRFGDKFDFKIDSDNIKKDGEYSVFPGLVQPFIENAIWHGVRGLEHRKGFIRIKFLLLSDAKIQCIIEDDGIGRKLANQFRKDQGHKSRGIAIVLERIRIINNLSKSNYKVIIEDLYSYREDSGTRVTIDLPVKKTINPDGY